jgi:drug/metabolite transporter (DMT)-like permease
VLAVLFGALAGAAFGALMLCVRRGLTRGVDAYAGAVSMLGIAVVVSALTAIPAIVGEDVHASDLWPFVLVGLVAPGAAQIILIMAVRDAGPSRAAILIGTAPLLSVAIALTVLGEPFRPLLVAGTILVVAGGAVLALERARPEHFKSLGAALALLCALLFAIRDNVARWAAKEAHPPALVATTIALAAAFSLVLAYVFLTRPNALRVRPGAAIGAYGPAGVALAFGYISLLLAFDHGRVSIVAPLNATQSLWAVVFAALVIGRRHEAISLRLVTAGVLVVVGSSLIGIVR